MSEVHKIGFEELAELVHAAAGRIAQWTRSNLPNTTICLYGVPRGGVPVALALVGPLSDMGITARLADTEVQGDVIVDDLIDSGATMGRYTDGRPFAALIDKRDTKSPYHGKWIEFPWEAGSDGGIEDNIRRLLQYVGDDPNREGLLETPARVAKAWKFWGKGYDQNPADVLKVFEDGAEGCDEMVVVKNIPFYSKCEHHLADIFGTATIGYVPNGKIVGLSKLNRVLDIYARRLQVQERLTAQVVDALMEHLLPRGAGVVIKARHMCMESRGVCQQGHHTVTSALRGVFKEQASTRAEFLSLANS